MAFDVWARGERCQADRSGGAGAADPGTAWLGPLFNGYSASNVIVFSANGSDRVFEETGACLRSQGDADPGAVKHVVGRRPRTVVHRSVATSYVCSLTQLPHNISENECMYFQQSSLQSRLDIMMVTLSL